MQLILFQIQVRNFLLDLSSAADSVINFWFLMPTFLPIIMQQLRLSTRFEQKLVPQLIAYWIPVCHVWGSVEQWISCIIWSESASCPSISTSTACFIFAFVGVEKSNVYHSIINFSPLKLNVIWVVDIDSIIGISKKRCSSIFIVINSCLSLIVDVPWINHWSFN